MNTANIKKYAPQARNAFIISVTKRANELGIYDSHIEEAAVEGQTLIVEGRSVDLKLKAARNKLISRVEEIGFTQLMEHVAYTWFNRLCAIRYMELHDYLGHGLRVLAPSPSQGEGWGEGGLPEILEHAQDVAEDLGLNRDQIIELKLAGNQDELLYRTLLLGQCHTLHKTMPFLFEAIDDETELLLPDNLTRTDSILRGLVNDIPAEDWEQVEVIGWLYQFYISEKKDEVIGKVVKSADIPAATQLFTPNWIVKYLVQNSVGRQWLQTYPDSSIKAGMEYYIEPAEQTKTVGAALAAITPDSIDPENIKILDPACGSGHILVEAYQVLKAIYEERGYRNRDIPKLILENNLFGLDIDDRAAQLAGFALMMLARADDRRIFTRDVQLNVMAIESFRDEGLVVRGEQEQELIQLFKNAKTLGSLIQVPDELAKALPELRKKVERNLKSGDVFIYHQIQSLLPIIKQAEILAQKYDAVVANPPYMGGKGMNAELKKFAKDNYPNAKSDLFAIFMEHGFSLLKDNGFNAQVNMQSWMFLSSYEKLREWLLATKTFVTMAHLGARAFSQISGEVVQTTAFVMAKNHIEHYQPVFFRLIDGNEEEKRQGLLRKNNRFDNTQQDDFKKIPGSPIAYWVSKKTWSCYAHGRPLSSIAQLREGLTTGDNDQYLRMWTEVSLNSIGFKVKPGENFSANWAPHNKGGAYRRWYGNHEFVVYWTRDGQALRLSEHSVLRSPDTYFYSSLSWSRISSGVFSIRSNPSGMIYDSTSPSIFSSLETKNEILALLNSVVVDHLLQVMSPTLDYRITSLGRLPIVSKYLTEISHISKHCVSIVRDDWNAYEISWNFQNNPLISGEWLVESDELKTHSLATHHSTLSFPLASFPRSCVGMQTEPAENAVCIPTEDGGNEKALHAGLRDKAANPAYKNLTVSECYTHWQSQNCETISAMQHLEQENNRLFIDAYGLQNELTPDVPLEQITLTVNPKYRYGAKLSDEALENRFQSDTLAELMSYAIGCMMGRYRVDKAGLIYAHAGNEDFDVVYFADTPPSLPLPGEESTTPLCLTPSPDKGRVGVGFSPDDDGIIPLTNQEWFADDATHRFREFVRVVWSEDNLQQNLDFVAESLCLYAIKPKSGESSLATIRRYLSTKFYKDHLKTYKKRPIYWLFSSGKQKAFECLVYLHRYNESTLSRMRTEYVTPLLGKYEASAMVLEKQMQDASSTAESNRFKKSLTALEKKQTELSEFDDKLKHTADMRISLDLDDGVKVNYGKFGDLLAEVKAVTGKKAEELI